MWHLKPFTELTTDELFAIYKARVEVFVVEQRCAYAEIDDLDKLALHLFQRDQQGQLKAYCRLIPDKKCVKLGRVLVTPPFRHQHLGYDLVKTAITYSKDNFPNQDIFAQAQTYLTAFYQGFGFECCSDSYLEDDIPHTDMILTVKDH